MKVLYVSLIALIFVTPSFATGIGASAESADCDNGVLGTYTGPASLSAQWNANTINLDFYDGETKLSSGTCTYDGGIELPNNPEKTGYEFSGWKVRRAAAAPTQVKPCSEIDNESECNALANCYYHYDICYEIDGVKPNCSEITNRKDCNSSDHFSVPGAGINVMCRWSSSGSCIYEAYSSGGSSD